uniref:Uncharacterized protein n=1 Tax=Globodera rostochiensis TaxID=31243 RepID=A0A914I6B8_GLORO
MLGREPGVRHVFDLRSEVQAVQPLRSFVKLSNNKQHSTRPLCLIIEIYVLLLLLGHRFPKEVRPQISQMSRSTNLVEPEPLATVSLEQFAKAMRKEVLGQVELRQRQKQRPHQQQIDEVEGGLGTAFIASPQRREGGAENNTVLSMLKDFPSRLTPRPSPTRRCRAQTNRERTASTSTD